MKIKITILFLAITILITGCASPAGTTNETPSLIYVNGSGTANAVPDIVDIQLGVEIVNPDPVEAVSENTTRMNAVMDALDKTGVSQKDIQTVYYNMWVEEVYDQNGQITGEKRYHVTNQINVRLDDLTKIGNLLEEATSAGATNIIGITFGISDTSELEKLALDNAIANAQQKAERIADDLSVELGSVQSVSESGAYVAPMPFSGEKGGVGGGSAVPISQGQFNMTIQVQVAFELIP
jgi:uncharacterized protein YggE